MAKRIFDFCFALVAVILLSWLLALIFFIQTVSYRHNGIFTQTRIGQHGVPFRIYKFRTMHPKTGQINPIADFLRQSKLDEFPQLINVLKGDMSIVGPRPDVPGYYDKLVGEERKILQLRPGITSPASLKYKNEETLLSSQENPLKYNDSILFPDKVKLNLYYFYNRSFLGDIKIIWQTVFGR